MLGNLLPYVSSDMTLLDEKYPSMRPTHNIATAVVHFIKSGMIHDHTMYQNDIELENRLSKPSESWRMLIASQVV